MFSWPENVGHHRLEGTSALGPITAACHPHPCAPHTTLCWPRSGEVGAHQGVLLQWKVISSTGSHSGDSAPLGLLSTHSAHDGPHRE